MTGNAYLALARLSSHPAFCGYHCCSLHCPLCPETFNRMGEYDRHVLNHPELTAEVAYLKLSGRTWDRIAPSRGWKIALADPALGEPE